MTAAEKNLIVLYRNQGLSFADIASRTNLSVNTVKSYCRRNKAGEEAIDTLPDKPENSCICKHCGQPMTAAPGKREKQFCSDRCRYQWWHLHRGNSLNASEHVCLFCGKPFRTNRPQKYCSHDCYIKGRFEKHHEPDAIAI